MTPTESFYSNLQRAYDHFNKELFNDMLLPVMFTTQRKKNVAGYFSKNRWGSKDKEVCHEIAINPSYISRTTVINLLQTIVHEQCHMYQYTYGKPSRGGYHNKEFSKIMQERGLITSTTGAKGGARTGQSMSDYPEPNGVFIQSAKRLIESGAFAVVWVDRFTSFNNSRPTSESHQNNDEQELTETETPDITMEFLNTSVSDVFEVIEEVKPSYPIKSKYHCESCDYSVWGKQELKIACMECGQQLEEH